jgi:hypothetical protein
MATVSQLDSKTGRIDSESVNTCSVPLPVRQVLEGEGGVRGRLHPPVRLVLTPGIVARFQSKIHKGSPTECWPWTAGKYKHFGYGQFNAGRDSKGRQDTRYAHRVAFQIATGIDPQFAVVMHSCDNPPCCNPAHLSLGTQADNVHDAARKGRYTGPRQRSQRLTDAQIADIRDSKETLAVVARRHGCSIPYASFVRRGLRRKVA